MKPDRVAYQCFRVGADGKTERCPYAPTLDGAFELLTVGHVRRGWKIRKAALAHGRNRTLAVYDPVVVDDKVVLFTEDGGLLSGAQLAGCDTHDARELV